jgi:hypothetical protein
VDGLVTANRFNVDDWTPVDADEPVIVPDPNGRQWWIFFPKGSFRHNEGSERKWGPYTTERKAAETLVGIRYQRRIDELSAEFNTKLRKRDEAVGRLLIVLTICTILLALSLGQ